MHKSVFHIAKMDCPSEENLIRMALRGTPSIHRLVFDLQTRELSLIHDGSPEPILTQLSTLNLGASLESSELHTDATVSRPSDTTKEASTLKIVLLINFAMFLVELTIGWLSESVGLIADSFDMLSDAMVYAISLYAVGKSPKLQKSAARLSGYFQLFLAVFILAEVIRRFVYGSSPEPPFMIGISALALIANVGCLYLISKHRESGVHMKASWIFSTNDVIANTGVIVAGILVMLTTSRLPDLIVGSIISVVVFRGALQILKISQVNKKSKPSRVGS